MGCVNLQGFTVSLPTYRDINVATVGGIANLFCHLTFRGESLNYIRGVVNCACLVSKTRKSGKIHAINIIAETRRSREFFKLIEKV